MNSVENLKLAQNRMLEILIEIDRVCKKNNIKYWLTDGTLLGAIRHKGFIPWDDDIDIAMLREDYEKFIEIAQKQLSEEYFLQNIYTDPKYKKYHIPLKVRDNRSKILEEDETENEEYNQGLFVDIFAYDGIPSSKLLFKIQRIIGRFLVLADVRTRKGVDGLSFSNKIAYCVYWMVKKTTSIKTRDRLVKKLIKLNDKNSNKIIYGVDLPCDGAWATEHNTNNIFPLKTSKFCGKYFPIPGKYDEVLKNIYGDYMKLPPEKDRVWHAKKIYIQDTIITKDMV